MQNIAKPEDLVYVCSPLNAPTAEEIQINMKMAKNFAAIVSQISGCRTIAPHSFLPEYLNDNIPQEREIGMQFCFSVLGICKAIVVCGNRISNGMKQEIQRARELEIPIYRLVWDEGKYKLEIFPSYKEETIGRGN